MAGAVSSGKKSEKFRCRRCRFTLFTTGDISETHLLSEQCNSWFLREDEEMLPWVLKLINEACWTEGKLYCPKCSARVGGFDFLHVVQCSCRNDVIPAIWCPKSKVDHIKKVLSSNDLNKVKHEKEPENLHENNGALDAMNNDVENRFVNVGMQNECRGSPEDVSAQSEKISDHVIDTDSGNCFHSQCSCHSLSSCSDRFKVMQCKEYPNPLTKDQFTQCDSNLQNEVKDSHIQDAETHQTFANIHQELEEMREEVLYIAGSKGKQSLKQKNIQYQEIPIDSCDLKPKDIEKKRRKARRRSKGNWQNEQFFLESSRRGYEYLPEKWTQVTKPIVSQTPKEHLYELELSDSEIPDCYKCAVCLSLLFEPYKTSCSHVFCGLCLRHLNSVTSGRPNCPLCRDPIRKVDSEKEVEQEIKETFPANYRKRGREARKHKHRKSPLPSAASSTFESFPGERGQTIFMNLINHISIAAMIISVVINSILVNANGLDPAARRNLVRKVVYVVIAVCGIVAIVVISVCLLIFAVDFFKIALFMVGSYVAISKFVLRTMID